MLESRSHDEVVDDEIAVQSPDKLIWMAIVGFRGDEVSEGPLYQGMVLSDGF